MTLAERVVQFRQNMETHFHVMPDDMAIEIDKLAENAERLASVKPSLELASIEGALRQQMDRIEVFLGIQQVH